MKMNHVWTTDLPADQARSPQTGHQVVCLAAPPPGTTTPPSTPTQVKLRHRPVATPVLPRSLGVRRRVENRDLVVEGCRLGVSADEDAVHGRLATGIPTPRDEEDPQPPFLVLHLTTNRPHETPAKHGLGEILGYDGVRNTTLGCREKINHRTRRNARMQLGYKELRD